MKKNLICPKCDTVIEGTPKFCPECGFRLTLSQGDTKLKQPKKPVEEDDYDEDDFEDDSNDTESEYEDEEEIEGSDDSEEDSENDIDDDDEEIEELDDDEDSDYDSNDDNDDDDDYDEDDEDDYEPEPAMLPKKKAKSSPNPGKQKKEKVKPQKKTAAPVLKDYDPNHDHYYDDVLPEIMDEINKFPTEVLLKIVFGIVALVATILYCVYYM